jgi:hypothetical protein
VNAHLIEGAACLVLDVAVEEACAQVAVWMDIG